VAKFELPERLLDERRRAGMLPSALTAPHGTLLFGDIHGTCEIPRFIGEVVTALVERESVVLALELRADQAPSIPTFLASDGGDAARAAMLADDWWQGPYFDGRNSVAMLELLETARRLSASGAPLEVLCFDAARPPSYQIDPEVREEIMARTVIAHRAARPETTFVVFAGNLHTRRTAWDGIPGFAWMAMRMAQAGVVFTTLVPRYRTGTAWTCGVDPASAGITLEIGVDGAPGISLVPDSGHDGYFDVGPITASPPAVHARYT
jgi:hypothetical protein